MKIKQFLFCSVIATLIFNIQAYAIPIDVYGTDNKTTENIIREVGSDLDELVQYIYFKNPQDFDDNHKKEEWKTELKAKIRNGISKCGNFDFIKISPIVYEDHSVYVTIDLIEKNDQKRLNYIPKVSFCTTKEITDLKKDKDLNNLFQEWAVYEEKGQSLLLAGKPPVIKECNAYHCIFGFDEPGLRKYLRIFDKGASKNKNKLITILKTDPDSERRRTAALLLAHIRNGQELIDILTPSMFDPNYGVRNNVMRVLGSVIDIVNPTNFDLDSVIKALDFPNETDRNKALYMIISLSNQPKHARYIAEHAFVPLMALLKMKQPNLHENAYIALCKISKESYGERDYSAWEAWFTQYSQIGPKT